MVVTLQIPTKISFTPQTQRIQATVGGEANIIASSVLYDASNTSSTGCMVVAYQCNGMLLTATQGGVLNFNSSVDNVLVSAIPDATPGGANQLINPINGSPITTDVFGNPRTNGAGFRDIGAVQVQVPEQVPEPSSLAGFVIVSLMVVGFVKRQENI